MGSAAWAIYCVPEESKKVPSSRTDRMGPTEQMALMPKLSSSADLPLYTAAKPLPMASRKGTVTGPVVSAAESMATAR